MHHHGTTIGDILKAKAALGDATAKAVDAQITAMREATMKDARNKVIQRMASLGETDTGTFGLTRKTTLVISKSRVVMHDGPHSWTWEVSTKPMPLTAVQAEWVLKKL